MFKRLRNRFLAINMVILSVLFVGAFAVTYIFTYNNTQQDIHMRLEHILREPRGFQKNQPEWLEENKKPDWPPEVPNKRMQMPKLSVDFVLELDQDGNLLEVQSVFDIDDAVYQEAAQYAGTSEKDGGKIRSEDTLWQFRRIPTTEGVRVAFLDVSAEYGVLARLMIVFGIVSLLSLLLIFFICLFFANRAIRPIEEAWEKQKRFIADASHELKTPLTTINANVDVLLTQPVSTEQEKWLRYIKGETERMTKLTNDLLYLARMEAEETLDSEVVLLSEIVAQTVLAEEAVAFEKQIMMEEEIEENLFVAGSRDKIRQLLLILLDNAVKYAEEGGNIRIRLRREERHALLMVYNSGDSLEADECKKIFDRFYRSDDARDRKNGGYGLGLSIAGAIVSHMKAEIWAEGAGDGTKFFVRIPLAHTTQVKG